MFAICAEKRLTLRGEQIGYSFFSNPTRFFSQAHQKKPMKALPHENVNGKTVPNQPNI